MKELGKAGRNAWARSVFSPLHLLFPAQEGWGCITVVV